VTNRILDDIAKATKPRYLRVTARFYVRGGIFTTVIAETRKRGWRPSPELDLTAVASQPSTR
jgi:7-cyano-7-deazaguanine reductase